ncbi:MAG: YihY/virulence factor BrkB family protein [Planctomycetota bacterium]|jgi:membrane protein
MAQDKDRKGEAKKGFVSRFKSTNFGKALFGKHTVQLGKAGRFAVFQIKLWSHCARLLRKNKAGQVAAALSYYTVFGFVPLAIVILLLFHSLGAAETGQKVKDLVYRELQLKDIEYTITIDKKGDLKEGIKTKEEGEIKEEGESKGQIEGEGEVKSGETVQKVILTDHLDQIIQQFYKGIDTGSVKFLSAVLVIWAALALLSKIEKTFNNIWHVARGRGFVHRIINYWAILTLGPLLVGLAIYIAAQYKPVGSLLRTIMSVSHMGPTIMHYLVAAFVLFWLYYLLPNTKVRMGPAIWGACCAALLWMFAKWGFAQYVTVFIPYSKVYGVVGLVPLAVFWIFITWLIVLFGLQVTYTTQHLNTLDAADIEAAKKEDKRFIANDITAINVVRIIAAAFEQSRIAVEAEVLCGSLDLPAEFGRKILDHLVDKGIIIKTSEPAVGYVPARDPGSMKLSEISDAVADVGFAQSMHERGDKLDHIVKSQRAALEKYSVKQILRAERHKAKSVRPKAPTRKRAQSKPASKADDAVVERPVVGMPLPIPDSTSDAPSEQGEEPPKGPKIL